LGRKKGGKDHRSVMDKKSLLALFRQFLLKILTAEEIYHPL
jgi:hypothetical protein